MPIKKKKIGQQVRVRRRIDIKTEGTKTVYLLNKKILSSESWSLNKKKGLTKILSRKCTKNKSKKQKTKKKNRLKTKLLVQSLQGLNKKKGWPWVLTSKATF